jgi:hypothetical protein
MQKTYTVNKVRFTGKQIFNLMKDAPESNGVHYIITLNGKKYGALYRQEQDYPFAPACSREKATAITLECVSECLPVIWIKL